MARPVRVMRWDDPGAPQRSPANAASIVDILKKCLVDGYGDTDPLGWTLEYEDAPGAIAVFRNSTANGSGGYLKVSPYTNDTGPHFVVQSAAAVLSINDLLYPGYKCTVACGLNDKRWIVIGTDTAFYMLLHHDTQNYNLVTVNERSFFAGDFIASYPADPGRFITLGNASGSSVTTRPEVGGGAFTEQVPFNYSSSTANTLTSTISGGASALIHFGTDGSVSSASYIGFVPAEQPVGFGAPILLNYQSSTLLTPFALKRSQNSPTADDLNDPIVPFIRGVLPGIYSALYPVGMNEIFPNIFAFNGVSHLGLANDTNSFSGRGCLRWINLEQW